MSHLIPDSAFAAMPQLMLLLVAAGAIYYLVVGSDWLVDGAAGLAQRLGIAKVVVGATVVSLGTTSPEAAVSVMAAWQGQPGLALGNAVGSIIADTGLIFGLGCILAVLPADRFVLKRQGCVDVGSAVLLAVLCYAAFAIKGGEAELGRWVGVLMLVLLVIYLVISVYWAKSHPHGEVSADADLAADADEKPRSVGIMLGLIVLGLTIVILASRFLIGTVTVLAAQWGIPEVVISSTIVAFGTSLPEFAVGMTAIIRGHKELLVGNVIGADILNVLFVIGASAIAKELPIIDANAAIPEIFLYLHLPTMLVMIGLFMVYIIRAVKKGHFERWNGYPLLILYLMFLAVGYILEKV
ncbi:MAG: sodium:calcium antiporter [Phycisphaeraceae bacterium]|nr:sodium:calcium antiporter [Phycisphaeraceae bacterium]